MMSKRARGFDLKDKYVPELNRNNIYGINKPGGLNLVTESLIVGGEYGNGPSHRA